VVSITGTGTLNTVGITAQTGAATGTGAGGTVGAITLNGSSVTAGALTTSGGGNGAGGNVAATASTGLLNITGAITTSGGTAVAGNAGKNAGSVTLNGNSVVATTIAAIGSAGNGASMAGGSGAAVTLTGSGGNISVGAISATGASAGASGNANGGNAGAITLDAGGVTPNITLSGNLTATGGNRIGAGTAGSGAQIWLKDATTQTANVTINTTGGTVGGAGGNIRFDGAMNQDATARTLTLTAGTGAVTLAGGTPTNAVTTLGATGASIALGNVQTKGTQSYTGAISLNGDLVTLGTAGTDTVTFNSPVTLTGNSSVTTAGGAGDNIAIAQTINGAYNLTLNAGANGNVTTTAAIGQTTALNAFSATGAAVSLAAVRSSSIFGRSTVGNLTLTGAQTATGGGDAVVLVAKQNFINNVGAAAINPGSGRWLVYSTNPSSDTRNGLVANFKQYNATYGSTILGTGNGFLYTIAPSITVGLTGTVSKTYDGTNTATLTAGNFTTSAGIDGDTVAVNAPAAGSFDTKNAGTGKNVSISGIALNASNGATTVYGYQVASGGSANANIGTINKANLTIAAQTNTKIYDGTTTAAATPTVSGLQVGDSVTGLAVTYDNKNAGTGKTLSVSAYTLTDGNSGNNYNVSTVADNTGVINKAALTVSATGVNKTYDGTTATTVTLTDNRVAGDVLTDSYSAANFSDKNAASGKTVSVSGIGIAGLDAINYTPNTNATTVANIAKAALTISADNKTKPLGAANPPLTASYSGLVPGDTPADVSSLALNTPATTASPLGLYPITPSGATATNYTIAYLDGTLAVAAAVIAASPSAAGAITSAATSASTRPATPTAAGLGGVAAFINALPATAAGPSDDENGSQTEAITQDITSVNCGIRMPYPTKKDCLTPL